MEISEGSIQFEVTQPTGSHPADAYLGILAAQAFALAIGLPLMLVFSSRTAGWIAASTLLAAAACFLLWHKSQANKEDALRFAAVGQGGVRLHVPGYYVCFVPFDAIATIESRASYSLREKIRDSFSLYGRGSVSGPHVLMTCSRLIRCHLTYFTRTFRIAVIDQAAFVETVNRELTVFRTEHPAAA